MKPGKTISALAAAGLLTVGQPAMAQDVTKFKVASFLPASHHIIEYGTKVWMDSIKQQLGDKVEIEFYPASQAGKANQLLDIMKAGALDVVGVPLGYYSDRFPLFGVVEMPGMVDNPCKGAATVREMATGDGLFNRVDIAPQGLHPLAFYIFPPYSAISVNPITSAPDFEGKKLRTAGGAMELAVKALGGVPVKLSSPEILQSLSRGTIDGTLLTYLSAKQYDLHTVAKNATAGYSFGGATIILMMSDARYKSLSDEMKAAVDEAGIKAEKSYCSFGLDGNQAAADAMAKDGLKVNALNAATKADLDKKLAVLSENWAGQLDGKGKPGSEALKTFRKIYSSK
ncbi:MAG: TRAP transporter substrate-binding protein DctP [Burkholderiaceae bacterium]